MSGTSIQSDAVAPEWISVNGQHDPTALELGSSHIDEKYFQLKVLKKKENDLRPLIPATFREQLSFLCYCMMSPLRMQILDFSHNVGIGLQIFYIFEYVIFKTLPHAFIVMFLSSYAPVQHMYASKMSPIFHGYSWQNILCGVFKLAYLSDNLSRVFEFAVTGLIYKLPWNECAYDHFNFTNRHDKCYVGDDEQIMTITEKQLVYCFPLFVFYEYSNKKETTIGNGVYNLNGTYFQVSQIFYFMLHNNIHQGGFVPDFFDLHWVPYCFIWGSAVVFHRQLFKKYIWRIFDCLLYILCFVYLLTFLYIEISFLEGHLVKTNKTYKNMDGIWHGSDNIELTAMIESAIAPMVHLFNSRRPDQVHTNRDSLLLSIAVLTFLTFQCLTYIRLKDFCESKAGIPVQFNILNSYSFYFLWTIFFKNFVLGPLYTKFFYSLVFCLEYLVFVISYQCLVEIFSCEWSRIKRFPAAILITVTSVLYHFSTTPEMRFFFYLYAQHFVTIIELIVVVWFYPYGRLIEDYYFFYGKQNNRIINILFLFAPFYAYVKFMFELEMIHNLYEMCVHALSSSHIKLFIVIPLLPVILGSLYKIFWTLMNNKAKGGDLFKPAPQWGPTEHCVRQYRKYFDSTKFIHSLGSRYICRFILKTTQPTSYRIDVQYENINVVESSDLQQQSVNQKNPEQEPQQ